MKKIMLAMMATVGLAFFAKAEETTKYPGSTEFEGDEFEVGKVLPDTDFGTGEERLAFWDNYAAAVGESKIVAGGPNESTKYASLDTGDKVLLRRADSSKTKDFGSIYFDTMVQFTASEGEPAVSTTDGDKLVIWLQSNEAVGTEGEAGYVAASTNLMIRAAELNTQGYYTTGSQDYTVDSTTPFEAGKWYRLTVKTFADISGLEGVSCPGFEVYIDGTKVSVTKDSPALYHDCFASLVGWGSVGAGELTGIGFQGTGAVDNIAMTSEDPIPPEATYTLAVTFVDEEAAITSITVNGSTVEIEDAEQGLEIPFLATTETLEISVGLIDNNYAIEGWDSLTKTINVAEAVDEDGKIALTITVVAAGEPGETTNLATAELSLDKDSVKEGEAAPTVTVTVDDKTLTEGTDYMVGTDYVAGTSKAGAYTITVTAVANSGYTGSKTITFTVTAEEPTTVVTPTAAEIESGKITVTEETTAIKVGGVDVSIDAFDVVGTTATVKAPVVAESAEAAGDAFVIDDANDEVTINVNPVAGLYYGVSAGTDLDALARPATLTQYDGTNAADIFTVSKPGDEKGFFKVYSDVKE